MAEDGRNSLLTDHELLDENRKIQTEFIAAAANVATPTAMTQAAITGGEAPTEAEFNALRTDVVNLRASLVAEIAALKAAGLQASS
jgi:hypothetical protein